MPFKRKVIAKIDCPRCNAQAELRPEDSGTTMFAVYLQCPKCRLRRLIGISSWQIYRNKLLIEKLRFLADETNDSMLKASLEAKIKNLEEINQKKELGL